MGRWIFHWVLIVGLFFLLATVAPPTAASQPDRNSWEHVTVTTTGGQVYEDVSVTWSLGGYSIKITTADRTTTQLRPSQVVAITDSAGQDITNTVAQASPATDINFALIGDQKIVPFEFDLLLSLGGSGAMYQADGGFKPVGAFLAGARIGLGTRTHVHVQYRRQGVIEPVHSLGGNVSGFTNEIHLLMGFRVTHPRENNNFHYVELGVSLVQFEDRFNAERETWNNNIGTGIGFTLQGGVIYPLSDKWGLDLGGTLMVRPTLVEDNRDAGLLVGINAALNRRF